MIREKTRRKNENNQFIIIKIAQIIIISGQIEQKALIFQI